MDLGVGTTDGLNIGMKTYIVYCSTTL